MNSTNSFLRILAAVMAVTMLALTFAACGKKNNSQNDLNPEDQEQGGDEPTVGPSKDDLDAEPITLKIGSYNIANGREVDHKMFMLAKDIVDHDLDIVGLQEVDQNCTRSGSIDTMKTLSEMTGYKYYAFFKAINLQGGEYGSAILSKYPILESESFPLNTRGKEARVLGRSAIDVNGTTVNFFVTHLSYEADDIRAEQFNYVNQVLSAHDRCILVGDFNISSLAEYYALDNVGMVNSEEFFVYTFPSKKTCIDNIIYSVDDFTFGEPSYLPNGNSDHNMIYATGVMRPSSVASGSLIKDNSGKELTALSDGMKKTGETLGKWAEGTKGDYIEIDLGYDYNLSSLSVINGLTSKNVYKWTAYASADPTLPIGNWIKIGEKTDDSASTGAGYTVEMTDAVKAQGLRYIRIYATYNSAAKDYPIAEIKVFGEKAAPTMIDLSSGMAVTDAAGNVIKTLKDRLLSESTDLGKWAEGTDGCYVDIDLKEGCYLHAFNVTQPKGGVYKWEAYATMDKDLPIDKWVKIGEKTNEKAAGDAGYTVILPANLKDDSFRYIRIYGTYASTPDSFAVSEVYVYGMQVSNMNNLMLGATVTDGDGDTVSRLHDGSTEEYFDLGYWAANVAGPAYGIDGQCYVQIDLGKLCLVDSIQAINLIAASRTYKWDAYATDDSGKSIDNWTALGGKTDNGKSTAEGYTLTLSEDMQKTPIRYIRIYGTYHNANCGYHLTEIIVRGDAVNE
ncbi:MAG: hypothetical protein E7616_06285 [Ruminococcaceae bacterium]|nr:hypothetical protein [Oscillospiraceae bacterium]